MKPWSALKKLLLSRLNPASKILVEIVGWKCPLCLADNLTHKSDLHREGGHCLTCGSSVRQREIRNLLSSHLSSHKYETKPVVLGMSDPSPLCENFAKDQNILYLNTFLNESPTLDVLNLLENQIASADILISSDILEHVPFPPALAVSGMYELLKSNGHLILTVPWFKDISYTEHYPWLVNYSVHENVDGTFSTIGFDSTGNSFEIVNPTFHGGPGNTLEMRLFTLDEVLRLLDASGFHSIKVHDYDVIEFGIRRDNKNIGTITAQK